MFPQEVKTSDAVKKVGRVPLFLGVHQMSSDIGPTRHPALDTAKKIFEILAIIVGGWWVLFTFWVKDCPNLERRVGVNADVTWHKVGDRCEADVVILVEN